MIRTLLTVLAFASSLAIAANDKAPPLVDGNWLAANLNQDNLVVLDVRSSIDNGGDFSSFQKGHIPGSVYSSYTADSWRESRNGVAGLLPPTPNLEHLISGLGISNNDTVVVVPAGTGPTDFGSAARIYWTFRVLGHDNITILNGGFTGWQAAGFEVASGDAQPRAVTTFKGALQQELLASIEEVQQARTSQAQLVDARPSDYFRGETKSPAARAAGTIPGSRNLPHDEFMGERDTVWYLNKDSITARINQADLDPATRTIAFCNTAHWAATDWFVLSELAKFDQVALYDGSMAEWSQDRNRPLQVAKKGLGKVLDWFN